MKVGDHAGNCDAPPRRECTPTTDEVRLRYGSLGYDEEFFEDEGEVFDRWMAEVERAAAARALRAAADAHELEFGERAPGVILSTPASRWLRAHAEKTYPQGGSDAG